MDRGEPRTEVLVKPPESLSETVAKYSIAEIQVTGGLRIRSRILLSTALITGDEKVQASINQIIDKFGGLAPEQRIPGQFAKGIAGVVEECIKTQTFGQQETRLFSSFLSRADNALAFAEENPKAVQELANYRAAQKKTTEQGLSSELDKAIDELLLRVKQEKDQTRQAIQAKEQKEAELRQKKQQLEEERNRHQEELARVKQGAKINDENLTHHLRRANDQIANLQGQVDSFPQQLESAVAAAVQPIAESEGQAKARLQELETNGRPADQAEIQRLKEELKQRDADLLAVQTTLTTATQRLATQSLHFEGILKAAQAAGDELGIEGGAANIISALTQKVKDLQQKGEAPSAQPTTGNVANIEPGKITPEPPAAAPSAEKPIPESDWVRQDSEPRRWTFVNPKKIIIDKLLSDGGTDGVYLARAVYGDGSYDTVVVKQAFVVAEIHEDGKDSEELKAIREPQNVGRIETRFKELFPGVDLPFIQYRAFNTNISNRVPVECPNGNNLSKNNRPITPDQKLEIMEYAPIKEEGWLTLESGYWSNTRKFSATLCEELYDQMVIQYLRIAVVTNSLGTADQDIKGGRIFINPTSKKVTILDWDLLNSFPYNPSSYETVLDMIGLLVDSSKTYEDPFQQWMSKNRSPVWDKLVEYTKRMASKSFRFPNGFDRYCLDIAVELSKGKDPQQVIEEIDEDMEKGRFLETTDLSAEKPLTESDQALIKFKTRQQAYTPESIDKIPPTGNVYIGNLLFGGEIYVRPDGVGLPRKDWIIGKVHESTNFHIENSRVFINHGVKPCKFLVSGPDAVIVTQYFDAEIKLSGGAIGFVNQPDRTILADDQSYCFYQQNSLKNDKPKGFFGINSLRKKDNFKLKIGEGELEIWRARNCNNEVAFAAFLGPGEPFDGARSLEELAHKLSKHLNIPEELVALSEANFEAPPAEKPQQ